MAAILDQARQLGNALARTDEYQALRRAIQAADDDREIAELRAELERIEGPISTALRAGKEPEKEHAEAYEASVQKLQTNATYQRLVAAQTNFDKVLQKVNQTISEGIEEAQDSRIILAQ
ncbi:MAG: YlbF family regulator [Longimicrobiales bacterium]|nr:YlbF family regulator [Longimicrobiales bacterium]